MTDEASETSAATHDDAEAVDGGDERDLGPDPVAGAGLTLLGILVMGIGGARDAHYLFDAGVGVAMLGAVTFVACVALSAMKQRAAAREGEEVEADAAEHEADPS